MVSPVLGTRASSNIRSTATPILYRVNLLSPYAGEADSGIEIAKWPVSSYSYYVNT